MPPELTRVPATWERRAFVTEMRAASAGLPKLMIGVSSCSAPQLSGVIPSVAKIKSDSSRGLIGFARLGALDAATLISDAAPVSRRLGGCRHACIRIGRKSFQQDSTLRQRR